MEYAIDILKDELNEILERQYVTQFKLDEITFKGRRNSLEKAIKKLEQIKNNSDLANISTRNYPNEYVILCKPNYINKNGEVVKAEIFETNGNSIYLAHKNDLYVR